MPLSANSSRLESHQLARTIDGHNVVLEVAVAKDNPIALQLLLRSGVLLQDRNYGVLHDLRTYLERPEQTFPPFRLLRIGWSCVCVFLIHRCLSQSQVL